MRWFWRLWAGAGIAGETYALARRIPGGTWSENFRPLVTRPRIRWVALAGYVALVAWFGVHIWR